jgi:hypothetical protein
MLTLEHVAVTNFKNIQSWFGKLIIQLLGYEYLFRMGYQQGWKDATMVYTTPKIDKAPAPDAGKEG